MVLPLITYRIIRNAINAHTHIEEMYSINSKIPKVRRPHMYPSVSHVSLADELGVSPSMNMIYGLPSINYVIEKSGSSMSHRECKYPLSILYTASAQIQYNLSLWRPLMGLLPRYPVCLPCDATRRQRSMSTLAQVMACCLTAPSHQLNQSWLIISKV